MITLREAAQQTLEAWYRPHGINYIDFRPYMDALRAALAEPVQDSEWEVRADGKRVRKDRWQIGIRRIVTLLWGNRQEFEVDEVVEAVRHLVPNPYAEGDDEALVKAALAEPVQDHFPDVTKMVQEPVAYRYRVPVEDDHWVWNYGTWFEPVKGVELLYTAPPQRKPLTEEEIRSMCKQTWVFEAVMQWVRAIERANGIGGDE